jgi:hypothetical protein
LFRLMKLPQLTLRRPLNVGTQSLRETAAEERSGIVVSEGANHRSCIRVAL